MNDNTFEVKGGTNQVAANVTTQQQIFYGDQFAEKILNSKTEPLTLVVMGAGVDATMGFPTSANLIPSIVEFLETEEGKGLDAILRKAIGGVRFHFDKFVSNAIESLAKDLDKELVTICRNINDELSHNASLDERDRKMGDLIVRLFKKILDIKMGASIDEETEILISEVFDTVVKDDSIIDFNHLNYTETFKNLVIEILQKSMHQVNNPILRHVYKNILDIEQLLSRYFYGFYTGHNSYVKDYLYISWILWAYLVHEQQLYAEAASQKTEVSASHDIYDQLKGKACQLLTFNYTSYARQSSDTALYFHGSLMEYVDVENKNDLQLDDILDLDIQDFFQNQLAREISFDADRKAVPIPSFLPPLKLQTVISKRYIDTWYQASQLMLRAGTIIILGYSFTSADTYFCDMLRENREAQIVIVDNNIEAVSTNVCRILQLAPNRYTPQFVKGREHRKYDNRVTIIQADLSTIDLSALLPSDASN